MIIIRMVLLIVAAIITVPALAGAAVIQLPDTGQTLCFDTNGAVIPCAGTGQDGEKQAVEGIGVDWLPATRFTDNGNGTMTDSLTGLSWTKDANAPDPNGVPGSACPNSMADMLWQDALNYIACLNTNGYLGFTDWRLPNLNEMESLVNAEELDTSAVLNAPGRFVNVQASQYWSSTSDASDVGGLSAANAWDMDMVIGDFILSIPKTDAAQTRAAWPVRGVSTGPAQIWRTGQTACFDQDGASRACAGTGEDGEKLAGAAWPIPRFFQADAGATAFADRLTGLIWTTDTQTPGPVGSCLTGLTVNWQQALDHVNCLNQNSFLGKTDWRLPNRKELRSLVDYSQGSPALPAGQPFTNILADNYWSSTTDAADTVRAWTVRMLDGNMDAVNKQGVPILAWPVSGPDLVAPTNFSMNVPSTVRGGVTQTISGTVDAGITPVVSVNTAAIVGTVTVTGTNWSCPINGMPSGANTITATATDPAGNVATITAAVNVIFPDGSFSGTGAVTVSDALKALRIAVGLVTNPPAADMLHGDVAPLVNGVPAPDGVINSTDALLILKKAVGLVNF
jgi:hypothetical protein